MLQILRGLSTEWGAIESEIGRPSAEAVAAAKQSLLAEGLPDVEVSILRRFGVPESVIDALPSTIDSFPDEYVYDEFATVNLFNVAANAVKYATASLPEQSQDLIEASLSAIPDTLLLPIGAATELRCYLEIENSDPSLIASTSLLFNDTIVPSLVASSWSDYDLDGIPDLELVLNSEILESISDGTPGNYLISISGISVNGSDTSLIAAADMVQYINRYGAVTGTVQDASHNGLAGVTIDVFDKDGVLYSMVATDAEGSYHIDSLDPGRYTLTIVTPLGYQATSETKQIQVFGTELRLDFELTALEIESTARSRAYWAHQLHKALQGRPKDYSTEDFAQLAELIAQHFNGNAINPVDFYSVPQPASRNDSLDVLKDLLHMRNTGEWEPMLRRLANSQLMALMLNVVSGRIGQTHEVSTDERTVSQLITYSDMLVSDEINPPNDHGFPGHGSPWYRYIYASFMLVKANLGLTIPAGMIPEDVIQIAYKLHEEDNLPEDFALNQNYPNPFNPTTTISFSLPEALDVNIEIFNIMGQKVASLVNGPMEAGEHQIQWDGRADNGQSAATGVYFYRLRDGDHIDTKKMLLLK